MYTGIVHMPSENLCMNTLPHNIPFSNGYPLPRYMKFLYAHLLFRTDLLPYI